MSVVCQRFVPTYLKAFKFAIQLLCDLQHFHRIRAFSFTFYKLQASSNLRRIIDMLDSLILQNVKTCILVFYGYMKYQNL